MKSLKPLGLSLLVMHSHNFGFWFFMLRLICAYMNREFVCKSHTGDVYCFDCFPYVKSFVIFYDLFFHFYDTIL